MQKEDSAVRSPRQESKGQTDSPELRKNAEVSDPSAAIDPADALPWIDRIRREVEFRHLRAAEIKAQLETLMGTLADEILKIRELKKIIETLEKNGSHWDVPSASEGSEDEELQLRSEDQEERLKLELAQELEKLLIIEHRLESTWPPPAEKKDVAPPLSVTNGLKKILVVDDDLTTVKIISHFLQNEHYRVSISLSGTEGLKKAFLESPDLILLDIMMPDLNGFQFLSIFRKDKDNARIPVVILSSLSEEADVLKGLEIGAADYIIKPFSPQVLIAKIKKNINSKP